MKKNSLSVCIGVKRTSISVDSMLSFLKFEHTPDVGYQLQSPNPSLDFQNLELGIFH